MYRHICVRVHMCTCMCVYTQYYYTAIHTRMNFYVYVKNIYIYMSVSQMAHCV